MPSKTFYNLDKIKQEKLVEAAMREFSKSSYDDASINKIIQEAGISRGSFYMYFNDKEDLFAYLFKKHRDGINKLTKEALIKNAGILDKSFIYLYEELIKGINSYQYKQFFINTFIYLNSTTEHFIKPEKSEIDELVLLIDKNKLKNDPYMLLSMLMENFVSSIAKSNKLSDEEKLRIYKERINIICYGGCK